jgi:hypothetical protein
MVEWLNMSGDRSHEKVKTVYNPIHSYLFMFPWGNDLTVNFDKIENQTNFCIWNTETNEIEDILFSILFVEEKDIENYQDVLEESVVLYETGSGSFYYHITSYGEDFGITDEIIISSFVKI